MYGALRDGESEALWQGALGKGDGLPGHDLLEVKAGLDAEMAEKRFGKVAGTAEPCGIGNFTEVHLSGFDEGAAAAQAVPSQVSEYGCAVYLLEPAVQLCVIHSGCFGQFCQGGRVFKIAGQVGLGFFDPVEFLGGERCQAFAKGRGG